MIENQASIREKRGFFGGCGNREEGCDGEWVFGYVNFDKVGMDLLELV